jgi:O-antigen/teichoic acid export membrane protein
VSVLSKQLGGPLLQRAGGLFGSQILGMGLAFACHLLATRLLGAERFGEFAFIQSLLVYLGILFEFGISIATCRLLTLSDDQMQQTRLCGAWLIMFLPIVIVYTMVIALSAPWVETIFQLEIRRTLLLCALPAVGLPLQTALRDILQGRAEVFLLALLNVAPWVSFLIALGWLSFNQRPSLNLVALSYFTSVFLTTIIIILALKPQFKGLKIQIRCILSETRSFGFRAFCSRVIAVGTFQLDLPMIAYFTRDTTSVGFYGLAKGIAAPISMLSRSLATVWFPRFATSTELPSQLIRANVMGLGAASICLFILAQPLISFLFPPDYAGVLPLLYIWAAVAFIQGAYQLPHAFLRAQGQGHVLQQMAILFAIANIVLNLLLISSLGAIGASLASGAAYSIWLILCIIYYKRITGPSIIYTCTY